MLWGLSLLLAAQVGSVICEEQHMLGSNGDGLNQIREKYNNQGPLTDNID